MRPVKIHISLGIRAVQILHWAHLGQPVMQFFHADNDDRSYCVDAQADFSLPWVPMSEGTFSLRLANRS